MAENYKREELPLFRIINEKSTIPEMRVSIDEAGRLLGEPSFTRRHLGEEVLDIMGERAITPQEYEEIGRIAAGWSDT